MNETITISGVTQATDEAKSARTVVIASLIGTTVEWYDFFLYGTITGLVFNKLFFPTSNVFVSTMLAYTVYAMGFATRPLGGLLFGHFGDRLGRKPLLILTLSIMGVSTFLIGLIPTYATIGLWAPALLLFLRLLQGIGLGGEWGGAVLMAFEYAPPGKRGLYASFPQVGLAIGLCLSTAVVALLSNALTDAQFLAWGWRAAFMASIVLVGIGMFVRLHVLETPAFQKIKDSHTIAKAPLGEVIRDYKGNVLLGWGARYIDGVVFNIYAVFALSYVVNALHYPKTSILIALTVAAFVLIFTIPLASAWSDRIGRRKVFGWGALVCGVSAFPAFALMQYSGNVAVVAGTLVVSLGIVYSFVYGPEAAMFCELFDARVRYSGISTVYQVSGIVSSSITPLIATALFEFGNHKPWWIAFYMLCVGLISALSTYFIRRTF